jgi:hypothetical protein
MTEIPETSKHVKVLFEVKNEDGTIEIESVWATPVPDGYKVDNIPFYARDVACNDVVAVKADEDGALRYAGLRVASGHSTIRLWFANEATVAPVREHLRTMGCSSELDLSRLVAVDVPPSVPYPGVRVYLDAQEAAGIFEYEEACLGQN